MPHIATEELVAFVLGECLPSRAAELERELAASAELAGRVEQIRKTFAGLQKAGDPMVTPSADAVQRLYALFQPRSAGWLSEIGRRVQEVVATLVLDSRRDPQLAMGFRGATTERHQLYIAEGVEIDLRFSAMDRAGEGSPPSVCVCGQIDSSVGASRVEFRSAVKAEVIVSDVDEKNYFEAILPPDRYELRVELSDRVAVVPRIDLGEP